MSNPIDTKNHPTVKALAAHQERLGLSGERFAKRYLRCSGAVWSQLKSGTYPADASRWLEAGEGALIVLQDEEATAKSGGASTLLTLSDQRAALNAVHRCASEPRNRLVSYLADTGGGKSELARQIGEKFRESALQLEATKSWTTQFAVAKSFAEALEITDDVSNALKAETAVIDALATSSRVISIDEAHNLTSEGLAFVKLILNRTKCRVLILSMPQLWARTEKKNWDDARQLRNRTFASIRLEKINIKDARVFLAGKARGFAELSDNTATEVATPCRDAANKFGLYNTLQLICDELNLEQRNDSLPPTVADVENAIKRVEALRG